MAQTQQEMCTQIVLRWSSGFQSPREDSHSQNHMNPDSSCTALNVIEDNPDIAQDNGVRTKVASKILR